MGLASSKFEGIGSGQTAWSKALHHGDDDSPVIGDRKSIVFNATSATSSGADQTETGSAPRGQGDAAERRKDEDAESQLKQQPQNQQPRDGSKKTTGWTRIAKNRISLGLGHLKRRTDHQKPKPTNGWKAMGVASPGYAFDKLVARRIEVTEFVDDDRGSNEDRPVISSRRFDHQQLGIGPTELYGRQHLLDEIPDFDVIGGRIEFSVKKLRTVGTKLAKDSQAGLECSMNPAVCKLHGHEKPKQSHRTVNDCRLTVENYDEIWASPYHPSPLPPLLSATASSDEKDRQKDVTAVSSASDNGNNQLPLLEDIAASATTLTGDRMPESIDDNPAEPDPSSGDLPDEWSDSWNAQMALIVSSNVVLGSGAGSGDIARHDDEGSTMPLLMPASADKVKYDGAETTGFGLQQQLSRPSAKAAPLSESTATQVSEFYAAKATSSADGWKAYMRIGRDAEGNTNNSNDDDKMRTPTKTKDEFKNDRKAVATIDEAVTSHDLKSPQLPEIDPEDVFRKEVTSRSAAEAVVFALADADESSWSSSLPTFDRWVSSMKHNQNMEIQERTSNGLPPVETL